VRAHARTLNHAASLVFWRQRHHYVSAASADAGGRGCAAAVGRAIHEKQPELSLCTRSTGLSATGFVTSPLGGGCAGAKGIHEKHPELSLCTRSTGLSATGFPAAALLPVPAKASQYRGVCTPTLEPAKRAAAGTAREEKSASDASALARGILPRGWALLTRGVKE